MNFSRNQRSTRRSVAFDVCVVPWRRSPNIGEPKSSNVRHRAGVGLHHACLKSQGPLRSTRTSPLPLGCQVPPKASPEVLGLFGRSARRRLRAPGLPEGLMAPVASPVRISVGALSAQELEICRALLSPEPLGAWLPARTRQTQTLFES